MNFGCITENGVNSNRIDGERGFRSFEVLYVMGKYCIV